VDWENWAIDGMALSPEPLEGGSRMIDPQPKSLISARKFSRSYQLEKS